MRVGDGILESDVNGWNIYVKNDKDDATKETNDDITCLELLLLVILVIS